jgi:adenylate kinase family enzyme
MEMGQRIIIVGNTGSGKSTLAGELARLLHVSHIEFDALYWNANWIPTPDTEFREKVKIAIVEAGQQWVIDGNYSAARDMVWAEGDTLIWLDYPLYLIFWRLLRRTFQRTIGKVELWNNNRERFWEQFFSRESLFLWAWQSHYRRKRTYSEIVSQNQFPNLRILHFKHPRDTDKWLRQLQVAYSAPEEFQP